MDITQGTDPVLQVRLEQVCGGAGGVGAPQSILSQSVGERFDDHGLEDGLMRSLRAPTVTTNMSDVQHRRLRVQLRCRRCGAAPGRSNGVSDLVPTVPERIQHRIRKRSRVDSVVVEDE
jgi:hypothetical protein